MVQQKQCRSCNSLLNCCNAGAELSETAIANYSVVQRVLTGYDIVKVN
jgi:hypothetical protein